MVDSGDEAHGVDERLPSIALAREDAAALRRQTIEAAPALAGLLHPSPLQPSSFFQPLEEWIE
jgi:hypothetical protein